MWAILAKCFEIIKRISQTNPTQPRTTRTSVGLANSTNLYKTLLNITGTGKVSRISLGVFYTQGSINFNEIFYRITVDGVIYQVPAMDFLTAEIIPIRFMQTGSNIRMVQDILTEFYFNSSFKLEVMTTVETNYYVYNSVAVVDYSLE